MRQGAQLRRVFKVRDGRSTHAEFKALFMLQVPGTHVCSLGQGLCIKIGGYCCSTFTAFEIYPTPFKVEIVWSYEQLSFLLMKS